MATPQNPNQRPLKPQPLKPQSVKPQPLKPQSVKPQPLKPQPLKPQSVKPQSLRPQLLKPSVVSANTPLTSQNKKAGLKPVLVSDVEEPKEISEEAASIATEISQVDANEYLPVQDEYLAEEIQVEENQEEEEEELVEKIQKGAPPWFLSTIGHVILLLTGALIFSTVPPKPKPIIIECTVPVEEEEVKEEEEIWNEEEGVQQELETETAALTEEPEVSEMAEEDNPVEDPMLEPESAPESEDGTLAARLKEAPVGARFNGRNPGGRKGLLGKYGGTRSTEDAVELGLQWLVKQQEKKGPHKGSWSLAGPYSDSLDDNCPNRISATAMALLAFQGAGYTQHPPKIEEKDRKNRKRYERKLRENKEIGKYRQVLTDGWNWLLKQQGPDGQFLPEDGNYNHSFYTHSQATIALCELYGMTKVPRYRKPAEKAIAFLLNTQHNDGGWKYTTQKDEMSDLSVTGWVLMALQSARMAELDVPQETLDGLTRFLDENGAANKQVYYRYTMGDPPSMTMTAEGILCRQYLGWDQNDPRMEEALTRVLTAPVSFRTKGDVEPDVYMWYYATQAMHHKEGHWWKDWNAVMRQEIPSHQVKEGKEKGSWDPDDDRRASVDGGRLYMTCLCIYMLEVYYRHLPIYAKLYDENGKINLDAIPDENSDAPAAPPAAAPENSSTNAAPSSPQSNTPVAEPSQPTNSGAEKMEGAIDTPENITGNFE